MDHSLDTLAGAILGIKAAHELKEFLKGLLTEKEVRDLARRIEIVRMLKKQIPQHEIARKLGVGIATVTRGSKELSKGRFKPV